MRGEAARLARLAALLLLAGWILSCSASAQVSYPVPHRSWVKLAAVAYQPTLTDAQLDFAASHFDLLDNPHGEFLAAYSAKTDAPKLIYDEFFSTYAYADNSGDWKWLAWQDWCDAENAQGHQVDYEEFFLHYTDGTRVPCLGTTDRWVANPRNANYQLFTTYWAQYGTADGFDGFFVDNAFPGVLLQQAGSLSGIREYAGVSNVSGQYDLDMVAVYTAARAGLGPKGLPGSKQLWLNSADYATDATPLVNAYPSVDGLWREFLLTPSGMYVGRYQNILATLAGTRAAGGVDNVLGAHLLGSTASDDPAEKLFALALYDMAAGPTEYFSRQDSNAGDLATYAWFGALEYDVGQPQAGLYTLATTTSYTVYARQFGKALVLARLRPNYQQSGPNKASTHPLPVTQDNPSGVYYQLNADGTLNPAPLTQISLLNGQGGVLIEASALPPPGAGFTGSPTSGRAPLSVQFTDTSTGVPTAWAWSFGDGSATSATQNPRHTYASAGTYSVGLTATNAAGSGSVTHSAYITVTPPPPPPPVAGFTGAPTSGAAPLTVQFTDASTGSPASWMWSFGDGGTSTAPSPSHTYAAAGSYTVSLTVSNAGGSNTQTRSKYIKAR